jgi:glycosyltransferase involved in cell wall biosynthesis
MRILQIIHTFPRDSGAGAENYTRQICEALGKSHDVAVLTRGEVFFDGPYAQIQERSGYPFPVYAYFRHPKDHRNPDSEYWNPDLDSAFVDLLKSYQPQIIHFQHCIGLSITLIRKAIEFGVPVFFSLHDFWAICPNILMLNAQNSICASWKTTESCRFCMARKFRAPRILFRKNSLYQQRRNRFGEVLKNCKNVLAFSSILKKTYIESGFGHRNLIDWPFGIDQRFFTEYTKKTDEPITPPIHFGFTGTLSEQKGVEVLLNAFCALPQKLAEIARLSIYGDSDVNAETKRRVQRWKRKYSHPNIDFKGIYAKKDLGEILQNLDVVVTPSTWLENRPLCILESFVAGNPVIASDLGGMTELVGSSGGGWTFPVGDVAALSRIISNLIENPELIQICRQRIPLIKSIDDEGSDLEILYL